jgi:hypothetical protein
LSDEYGRYFRECFFGVHFLCFIDSSRPLTH